MSLVGAKVEIPEQGRSTYTEDDGTYSLRLPGGTTATVTVTYPGLSPETVTIQITDGVTTRDFKMTSDIYFMEKFSVNGIREGNAAAIAHQEQALTISNKISADAYGNIAKGDLGSFLQRLPGVVGDYGGSAVDSISVRGLSPEFTTVTLDGVRAASAGFGYDRSQLVSGMPADSIESVEVIKTPTADMDGDSLGGVVNLRPRSGFDRTGRSIVLNASIMYNDTFGKNMDPSDGQYLFPQYSAQYSDVFKIGNMKLGASISATYQEVGEAPSTIRAQFAGNWNYTDNTSVGRRFYYADQEFHINKRAGINARFDLKLAPTSSISFSASYNRASNYMDQNRPQYQDNATLDTASSTSDYWVFSRVRYRTQHDYRDTAMNNLRFMLNGKHEFNGFELTWDASYESSKRDLDRMSAYVRSNNDFKITYDRRYDKEFPALIYNGGITPDKDDFKDIGAGSATATHEYSSDILSSARIDLAKAFGNWTMPMRFKTGIRVRQEERERDPTVLDGTFAAGDYSKYRDASFTYGWGGGHYPATPVFDTRKYFADTGVSYSGGKFTYNSLFPYVQAESITDSLQNDWKTKEVIPAIYLQTEITILKNLRATLGVRYEQTKTELTNRKEDATQTDPALKFAKFETIKGDYGTWFPNVQLRYEPKKHLIFRAAYSTTIGRPRLSDLTGRFSVNDKDNASGDPDTISFSNPTLKPQMSRNYDISIEYYFSSVGVISVGFFHKTISDYVTTWSNIIKGDEFGLNLSQYVGWQGTTKANSGDGVVKGMEINYSQQLRFLPGVLKDFGVMANWTQLESRGDYNGTVGNLPFKNNLTGMRPESANAGITYVAGRWDLRLMWNYQSAYLVSVNSGDPSSSEFIGERQQWDFFARFRITKNFNIFVDVINLGNDNRSRYNGLVVPERWAQTTIFSRSITAGVQARF